MERSQRAIEWLERITQFPESGASYVLDYLAGLEYENRQLRLQISGLLEQLDAERLEGWRREFEESQFDPKELEG